MDLFGFKSSAPCKCKQTPKEEDTNLNGLLVTLLVTFEILQRQSLRPISFMKIHQHRLLEVRLTIVDHDRVVVSVQAVNESLNGRFVDLANIRCRLPGFLTSEDGLWTDKTESVNHDFALHGLNGVDYDCDGTRV